MSHHLLHRSVAGEPVTREHASTLLRAFAEGHALPEQLAAALTALRIRGESPEVLIGFAEVLREQYIPVELAGLPAVDLCGTGGDGQHTVNLSTAAAFVVAGAGVPVAKHGNHGVSSKTGSADVLQALGLPLKLSPEDVARCIREIGIGFIYAPAHHPLFAKIGPVRRALGFRTAFNLLGPVCNPAQVKRQVIGAFNPEAVRLIAEVLAALGTERAFVVHTPGPYDEVSLTAPAMVLEVSSGTVSEHTFTPEDFGTRTLEPGELAGGDAASNAAHIEALLKGQKDGVRLAVCANAACAIVVAGKAQTLAEGFRMAEASIDSGAAFAKLEALRAFLKEPTGGAGLAQAPRGEREGDAERAVASGRSPSSLPGMGFLTDHNAFRRAESAQRRIQQPESLLRERIAQAEPCRDFAGALLAAPAPGVIAEVKFRSPSKGSLRPAKDVEVVAQSYEQAGASCLSILVDQRHFDGDWAFLGRARKACSLPLLAKGFFCDPYDLLEARASGADAALLIARSLSRLELETMLSTARELGLQTLLELHDEDDLAKAQGLELDLVGINHRDLDTLVMDMDLSRRIAGRMPRARVKVSESGLNTAEDLQRMVALGYQAVLMGTRFMSQPQPGLELAELLKGLHAAR